MVGDGEERGLDLYFVFYEFILIIWVLFGVFLRVKVSDWDSPLGSHHSQTEVLPEVSVRADPSLEQTQQQLRGSIKCSKRPQREFPPKFSPKREKK